MKRTLQFFALFMAAVLVVLGSVGAWYAYTKQPVRSGTVGLRNLQAPVSVQYDERGVPHIRAQNEADLYRALGYVHAQDRLFQMDIVRRLANGELKATAFLWTPSHVTLIRSRRANRAGRTVPSC